MSASVGMSSTHTGLGRAKLPSQSGAVQRLAAAHHTSRGHPTKLETTMRGYGKFIVGGNWKCNGTLASVQELIKGLNEGAGGLPDNVDVVVAPPFLHLSKVLSEVNPRFEVSAQNAWVEPDLDDPDHHYDSRTGAFTGEVSAEMLEDMTVPWVIIGHSERRTLMGETNEIVGKKVAHARYHGLSVIACVGESLEQREAGKKFYLDIIFSQLQAIADEIDDYEHSSWGAQVVIAYEPIWAIGTGKVATPAQAQEVHAAIRKWLHNHVSPEVAASTRIQYGGSVNASNCSELAQYGDIDGFLVGGASLNAVDFVEICKSGSIHYKAVGMPKY